MTEHSFKGEVVLDEEGDHWVSTPGVPRGAEVTVTWTEPPEPTGRWVVVTADDESPPRPMWRGATGTYWQIRDLFNAPVARPQAEAALVDLIESDHLPPQMPSVDEIHPWLNANGYTTFVANPDDRHVRHIIAGVRDAIAALAAHEDTPR